MIRQQRKNRSSGESFLYLTSNSKSTDSSLFISLRNFYFKRYARSFGTFSVPSPVFVVSFRRYCKNADFQTSPAAVPAAGDVADDLQFSRKGDAGPSLCLCVPPVILRQHQICSNLFPQIWYLSHSVSGPLCIISNLYGSDSPQFGQTRRCAAPVPPETLSSCSSSNGTISSVFIHDSSISFSMCLCSLYQTADGKSVISSQGGKPKDSATLPTDLLIRR